MEKTEIRVNEDLLKQVEPILKEFGLTVEKAVELYFKEVIRSGKIPFPLDENKPKTFTELTEGFEGEYEYEEWDTGKPVGEEDIYRKEYMQAKANFDDLQERGVDAICENALEFIDTLLTEEEIKESDIIVARIKPKN